MIKPGSRLLISHALAATAMATPWPLLLTQVWTATQDELFLGLAGAARMLPYVLLSPFAGILADRMRRSTVLRWSTATRAVSLAACALALLAGRVDLGVFFATLTVALGAPAYPAAVAAMPQLAGARTGRVTSLLVTAEAAAFVVGPAVGGLLLSAGWGMSALGLSLAATAAAWLLLRRLHTQTAVQTSVTPSAGRLRTVLGAPGVAAAIAVVACMNFVEAFVAVSLLGMSYETWLQGDSGYGIAIAALGFGSLAAPLLILRFGLRGSLVLTATGFGAAGIAPTAAMAAAPLAVAGGAGTVVECVCTDVLQQAVPDRIRAFALGLADGVMVLAAMIGTLVAPFVVSVAGAPITFAGAGLLVLATALVVGYRRRPAMAGVGPRASRT